ncbi:universal stress protein [Salinimicrobium soli]|uniref:universal stress protein n=1 Tax=Salinimicrobium soli TaxID=1254399 RepID=UPI003AAA96A1
MKKLIYTTDYSSNSIAALKYTASLGRSLNSDIIVLHVYSPEEEKGLRTPAERKAVRERHQKRLEEFCKDHLKEDFVRTELSYAAIKGANVAEAIADFIRDMSVYLVIMGASKTSTLKEVFLSSTSKEVTSALTFPILAVPADHEPGAIKKVLFASVFNDEDIHHLGQLVQVLAFLKPAIEVVHVTHKAAEPAREALENFKNQLIKRVSYPHISCRSIYSEDVYGTIKETIQNEKPDVLVIPDSKERNEVDRLVIREKIKGVQTSTGVPVMCFPPAH